MVSKTVPRRIVLQDDPSSVAANAFASRREVLSPDDADILAGLKAERSGDLNVLFNRYSGLVLAIALRILGNRSEAEEVVQEVFLYIYERSQVFDPLKGSAKAWIIQIAFSRSLDRKSYLARRGFYAAVDIGSLDDSLAANTDLEQETEARLNRKRLERAFAELTEMQRRTIEFFYFGGLELREISERLSEPLGNVRHHLYRGLERLRKSDFVLGLLANKP